MFKTAVVVAALATATAVQGYAVYPDLCKATELAKLATVLVTNLADYNECSKNSEGWVFIPPTAAPTIEQETAMCKNTGCTKLLAGIKRLNPSDCFLSVNNSNVGINVKQLVDEFEPFCEIFGQ